MNKFKSIKRIILKRIELIAFFIKYKNKQKFIIFSTPTHGNLGDQAIAFAQENFLNHYFPNTPTIELNLIDVARNLNFIKKNRQSKDIFFIHGGGNMGNLYPIEEDVRLRIVSTINDNQIFSFPQSIYFEDNDNRSFYYNEMKKIYQNNSDFKLVARESISLKKMNQTFPQNKVLYTPDIVFFLTGVLDFNELHQRDNVLTLLRDDKEKSLDKQIEFKFLSYLKNNLNYKIDKDDTQLGNNVFISKKNRQRYVFDKLNQIMKYEFVITDRLHGMIFCYLTKTPCLVLQNNNSKIKATYNDWLLSCKFIKMLDDTQLDNPTYVNESISEILEASRSNNYLDDKFFPLVEAIKGSEEGSFSK